MDKLLRAGILPSSSVKQCLIILVRHGIVKVSQRVSVQAVAVVAVAVDVEVEVAAIIILVRHGIVKVSQRVSV